ncbi:MAG: arsenical efflux pump membrane protein ArsB [Aquificota bacterium]|nr:MAG: arsenical efflux pump membrane protein ArsB [Aquificota bacterium]
MEKTLAFAIFAITLFLVITRPKGLGIGWSAWIGALGCLLLGLVSLQDILYITKLVWDATLAFIFLIFISIILDKAGFFEWMALKAIGYAKGNGVILFISLMLLGAFISAIFANDGASLMLTPIIYSKIKHLKIPEKYILPYIMGSGFIADSASLPLVISNLTNIITAHFFKIDFWQYAFYMFLPNLVSVITSITVLYLFYRREVVKRYDIDVLEGLPPKYAIKDPFVFKIGWVIILLLGASFLVLEFLKVSMPFSLILGFFALLLAVSTLKNRTVSLKEVLKFTPWNITFFSVGMYAVVYSLKKAGLTNLITDTIVYLQKLGDVYAILGVGILSALLSAIMNNLPTVMIVNISIIDGSFSQKLTQFLAFSNLIGTNIGPKLTPIGSLATLLWLHVLEYKGIRITYAYYMKVGFILTLPVLLTTLLTLCFIYYLRSL